MVLGIAVYVQDHDDKYPLAFGASTPSPFAEGKTVGWANDLQPYLKSYSLFSCPDASRPIVIDTLGLVHNDYWMNANLSAHKRSAVTAPILTLMIGEGDDGIDVADAGYGISARPPRWLSDARSPLYRHLGGANYAFTDGHVKWFTPPQIQTLRGSTDPLALR